MIILHTVQWQLYGVYLMAPGSLSLIVRDSYDGVFFFLIFQKFSLTIFSLSLFRYFDIAYYGILFRGAEEAAFSNFRLFESCGSVITYILSPMLCASTKIDAVCALMVIGIIG